MRITKTVDKIITDNRALILKFKKQNRMNVNIIALILCELYFSHPIKRFIEYLVWFFLTSIRSEKRNYISVGISQVQIRHWKFYEMINDRITIKNLKQFLTPEINYDLVQILLKFSDFDKFSNSNIIAAYRGEARSYHVFLFNEIKKRLSLSYREYYN